MKNSKTILITGASRGIGLLTAKALARKGHIVYASMRDIDNRNAAAAKEVLAYSETHNVSLFPIELNVTDETSCEKAVKTIEATQPLDVLINNAGVMPVGLTEAYTLDQVQALFDVNVYGIMRMNRAVLPQMRARKSGLIISLSSSAGRFGMPYFGQYCASKWAMEAYCEALHYELEAFGVESLLVEPSGHSTDLVETAPKPADKDRLVDYGDVAKGGDRLLGMFHNMFEQGDPSTDANNVADRIANLIEMRAPRPIRTQVGQDMGVSAVNDAVAPIQAELIKGLRPIYMGKV